ERPRSLVGRLVTAEVLSRIRGLVDVWLRTVRGGEYDVVTRFDQCHGGHDGFVQVLAGRPRAATSDLDPGGIGTDHKHLSLAHNSSFWETPLSYESTGSGASEATSLCSRSSCQKSPGILAVSAARSSAMRSGRLAPGMMAAVAG